LVIQQFIELIVFIRLVHVGGTWLMALANIFISCYFLKY
jgi:hypothetical protein